MAYDFLADLDTVGLVAATLGGGFTEILARTLAPRITGLLKRHDAVVSRAAILLNALDQAIIDGNPRLQGSWLDLLLEVGAKTLDGVTPAEVMQAANKALELYDAKVHDLKARRTEKAARQVTGEPISGIAEL